jgi:hypothetical protein
MRTCSNRDEGSATELPSGGTILNFITGSPESV